MARELAALPEDAWWFVPDIDGNRDDPVPFRLKLAPMSARDLAKLEAAAYGSPGEHGLGERIHDLSMRILRQHVLVVEHYRVGSDRPNNGNELVGVLSKSTTPASEKAVIDAVVAELRRGSRMEGQALGKSEPPSGSASTPTASTTGSADSAPGLAASPQATKISSSATPSVKSEGATALQTRSAATIAAPPN